MLNKLLTLDRTFGLPTMMIPNLKSHENRSTNMFVN